jgi:hypothetical protein
VIVDMQFPCHSTPRPLPPQVPMRGTHASTLRPPARQVNVGRGTPSYAGKTGQSKRLPSFAGCTTRNSRGPAARLRVFRLQQRGTLLGRLE